MYVYSALNYENKVSLFTVLCIMKTRSMYVYSALNYQNKVSMCLQWFEKKVNVGLQSFALWKQGHYMFTVVWIMKTRSAYVSSGLI